MSLRFFLVLDLAPVPRWTSTPCCGRRGTIVDSAPAFAQETATTALGRMAAGPLLRDEGGACREALADDPNPDGFARAQLLQGAA